MRQVSSRCGQAQLFNQRMIDAIRQILDKEPLYSKAAETAYEGASATAYEKFAAASHVWRPDGLRTNRVSL